MRQKHAAACDVTMHSVADQSHECLALQRVELFKLSDFIVTQMVCQIKLPFLQWSAPQAKKNCEMKFSQLSLISLCSSKAHD
jgi:hypothetical protein